MFGQSRNALFATIKCGRFPKVGLVKYRLITHRRDSIQGTDYIANYFVLNLRVSRTTIENLRCRFGGDIILLTFGKFVTLLVQKLKILGRKTDL